MDKRSYLSYNFIDKDPIIDYVRTAQQDAGLSDHELAEISGLAKTTIRAWMKGKTTKPQAASIRAALRACRWDLQLVKLNPRVVVTEQVKSSFDNVVPMRRKFIKGRRAATK